MALILRLLLFQYTTMARFHPMAASVSYLDPGSYWRAVSRLVSLRPVDGLLLAAIVALCLTMPRSSLPVAISVLRSVFTSESATICLLLASSFVFVRCYLSPGHFNWAADSSYHLA